jgi:hypothetical protein
MNSSLLPTGSSLESEQPPQRYVRLTDDDGPGSLRFLLRSHREHPGTDQPTIENTETNTIDPAVLISLYSRLQEPSFGGRLLQRGIPDIVWEVIEALGRLCDGAQRLDAILESYSFSGIAELRDTSAQMRIAERLLLRLSELSPSQRGHWGEAQQAVQLTKQLVLMFHDQLELGISEIAAYAQSSRNPGVIGEVSKWTARMLGLSDALSKPYIWDALYTELLVKATN